MISVVVKLLVASTIIALILWNVGIGDAFDYARRVSPQGVVLVVTLMVLQLAIGAVRQQGVAKMFESSLSLPASLQITFVGSFFSQTFLSVIGGDMSRVWLLVRLGISVGYATCIVVFDRLMGLMAHQVMVLAALPWLLAIFVQPGARAAVVAVAIAGTAASALLLAAGFLGARFTVIDWLPEFLVQHRVARGVMHLITVKRAIFLHPSQAAISMLLSLVMAIMNSVIVYTLFRDIGANVSLLQCLVIVPLLMEVALLPITISGCGVREALMIFGFAAVGVPPGQALLCSVLFGLCGIATSLIGGVIWLATRRDLEGRDT